MSTPEKTGEFVTLEFTRMSDVTDQYVTSAKRVSIAQYVSIKSAPTHKPTLFQGPTRRDRVHKIKVSL